MRGDRGHLDTDEHSADRAYVLLQCGQDRWHVPQDVDALRGGDYEECQDNDEENERGAINGLVIHDDTRARAKPPDELRSLAIEPINMSICVACVTYPFSRTNT